MPSATKKRPMFAPAASARCGRNATMTPQWTMYSRSMAISGAQARRNAKPRRRRATSVGPCRSMLDSPLGRKRNGTMRRIARPASTNATAISATPCSDVAARTASDSGGMTTRVRLWALPDEGETEPAPVGRDEPRDERQGRRQRRRDADALEDAGRR